MLKIFLDEDVKIPRYKTKKSSGLDVAANKVNNNDFTFININPQQSVRVHTGVYLNAIPENSEIQLRIRSSLAEKGLLLVNGVGTIDEDYTNTIETFAKEETKKEIICLIRNISNKKIKLYKGDRIAQLIIAPIIRVKQITILHGSNTSTHPAILNKKRIGGFGSTGK